MDSEELSVKITIHCPICNAIGKVNVKKNIIMRSDRGVTAVNVTEHLICEISFVSYIDKNLDIR